MVSRYWRIDHKILSCYAVCQDRRPLTSTPPVLQFAKIKPALQPGSGRGLIAISDIQPGDCICNVPVSAALRVFPGCPPALQVPAGVWQQLPWYGQLALTILSEWQQGSASKWADYIKQLPAAVDVPALWRDAELQQLRCGYFIEQVGLRSCHCGFFSPMSCSSSSGAMLL